MHGHAPPWPDRTRVHTNTDRDTGAHADMDMDVDMDVDMDTSTSGSGHRSTGTRGHTRAQDNAALRLAKNLNTHCHTDDHRQHATTAVITRAGSPASDVEQQNA